MMDNTPGLLHACALNKAVDASLYSYVISKVFTLYVISKVFTPSIIKESDSKCFREAPIDLTLQICYDGSCSF